MKKTNGLKQSAAQIAKLKILEEKQRLTDESFMAEALVEAEKSKAIGEVPVGAVIVKNGEIVARGHNRKETDDCAVYHAEINAVIAASRVLGWRLDGCDIYVTLEPCAMCAGAILSSRVSRVVFGASEPKSGFFGSVADISHSSGMNHSAEVVRGVLRDRCEALISEFFSSKR